MIGRRDLMRGAGALALAAGLPGRARAMEAHAALAARAEALARAPHRPSRMPLHGPFGGLDYDRHRGIRPRPGLAADLPLGPGLRADLLPPGFLLADRVRVTLDGREIPFAAELFDFEPRYFDDVALGAAEAAEMGFAGLRLRSPLNRADVFDDLAVFQGASYFRMLARGSAYGLSARGLALGTGGAAEEFPVFTELYSAAEGDAARVRALMESPSVTGAFSFLIRPGAPTVAEVEAALFPRVALDEVGIAPLTSMYFFGPMRRAVADDFRPAVHDSDALVVLNGAGERLWRPLANPARLQISAFGDTAPRGFGLVQSRTGFADFNDPEAAYHRRPSVWVEPVGDWGAGAVVLVEIPTEDEFHDNIAAFWRPAAPLAAGRRHDLRYRLHWGAVPAAQTAMPVAGSAAGRAILDPEALTYVVDFEGFPPPGEVMPDLQVTGAESYGLAVFPVPEAGVTRVSFKLVPGTAEAAELRLVLRDAAGRALGDSWLYRWTRARDGGI
jgi:glucans biosynthesis protein